MAATLELCAESRIDLSRKALSLSPKLLKQILV